MNVRTRLVRMVAFAVAVIVVSGCTSGQEVADEDRAGGWVLAVTPAPVPAMPVPDELPQAELPLTAYVATNQQRRLVDRAYVTLLNQCMAGFGFPSRFTEPAGGQPEPLPVTWRYGVGDPAIAAEHGYRVPLQHRFTATNEREQAAARYAADPMSESEEHVYAGGGAATYRGLTVPPGGCLGETERRLGATEAGTYLDDLLAQTLRLAGFDRSREDPRVVSVITLWRACMEQNGYSATDPLEAPGQFDLPGSTPTAPEIRMATADATCKQQTNLVGVWYAVETAYQEALIEANADQLENGRRSVEVAVRAATAALDARG